MILHDLDDFSGTPGPRPLFCLYSNKINARSKEMISIMDLKILQMINRRSQIQLIRLFGIVSTL